MKATRFVLAAAAAGILAAGVRQAQAVPAFARQTGASCSACHFQHFPGLTPYGRFFKSGGYLMTGQNLIESRFLSIPAELSASMVTKIRYVKTNGASGEGTDRGELQFPDEAAFFLGGRVGTHVGFLLEAQLADPDAPMFASFKLPIGTILAGGRLSAIPFSTDGLGVPFGFELLNTGAVRNVRAFEERATVSAQQYVVGGGGEGTAEGVALVYSRPEGYLNVTPWTPGHGTTAVSRPAWYLRAAVIRPVGGWDVGAGMQWWTGTAEALDQKTAAWAADVQLQGTLGPLPAGVYLTYARAEGSGTGSGQVNFFNPGPMAQHAVAGAVELGLLPGRLTVGAGYRLGDNGSAAMDYEDNAVLLGATFQLAQNIQLQLNHMGYEGLAWADRVDNQKTLVMLFAAF